jgi:hypothetical protein
MPRAAQNAENLLSPVLFMEASHSRSRESEMSSGKATLPQSKSRAREAATERVAYGELGFERRRRRRSAPVQLLHSFDCPKEDRRIDAWVLLHHSACDTCRVCASVQRRRSRRRDRTLRQTGTTVTSGAGIEKSVEQRCVPKLLGRSGHGSPAARMWERVVVVHDRLILPLRCGSASGE